MEDDTSGKLGARIDQTTGSLFAINEIPTGFKATHVHVYASSTVSSSVTVNEYDTTNGDITSLLASAGSTNTNLDITDLSSSTSNAISIAIAPGSTSVLIYSVHITIATI